MPTPFTTEQALLAREKIDEQRAKYRQDYHDDEYWKETAKSIGQRLPPYYARPSDQDIKFWLKICKVPYSQFVDSFGWKNAAEFELMNPTHGMKVLAGLILELMEENKRIKKVSRERADDILVNTGSSEPTQVRLYKGESKQARRAREA
jgi:hypothetical protein